MYFNEILTNIPPWKGGIFHVFSETQMQSIWNTSLGVFSVMRYEDALGLNYSMAGPTNDTFAYVATELRLYSYDIILLCIFKTAVNFDICVLKYWNIFS